MQDINKSHTLKIASRVNVENPPEWHAVFGIRAVTESDAMETWIQRAHNIIDHFIIMHQKKLGHYVQSG